MRAINEMTVPGKWEKVGKDSWEMDAGKGWTISVYKDGGSYRWEVSGRKHSSSGREKSFKNAQTIGIKQYRQVREERETDMYRDPLTQGIEPDTKEEFQTTGKSQLDDYGLIAKINRRNRMRALNLLNGKAPVGEAYEPVLRQRGHSHKLLMEAKESAVVKKMRAMSIEKRKSLGMDAQADLIRDQYAPYVKPVVKKIVSLINSESKKMPEIFSVNHKGELISWPYRAKGFLEQVVQALEDLV